MINPIKPWYKIRWLLSGVIAGALYGLVLRFLVGNTGLRSISNSTSLVMTIAFLLMVPFVIGLITISEAEGQRRTSVAAWIFAPWLPTLLACVLAVLFRLEGIICLVFAVPITLVGASIGGVVAGLFARSKRIANRSTLACFALLPLIIAPAEGHLVAPIRTRTVASEIRIHSAPATIWHNIERVPAISPAELRPSWAQYIGFPRPIEATLSYEGVGGIRHATFERGLTFIETVTAWEPQHRLAFSIKADTAHIPPTTLDEHVTIGGPYFDVLDGEYRLEPLSNGNILLHLTSHQRLSTDFNGYAGFWSDAVMQNLQTSILEVIRHRCEHPVS
ncbi:MAG: hypothetical protein ABI380_15885 [Edaphobacter sp.]